MNPRNSRPPKASTSPDWKHPYFQSSLLDILDVAMRAGNARLGNIQVFNRELDGLEICVQRGFSPSFLESFKVVRAEDSCACGRALRWRKRVSIPDITVDPFFQPFLDAASKAGFRSVQSTPIINFNNDVVGVLSTHFAGIHYLSTEDASQLDRYATMATELIDSR